MLTLQLLKNMNKRRRLHDRPQAIWGTLLSAGIGLASNLISSKKQAKAQEEAAAEQAAAQQYADAIRSANNMSQVLNAARDRQNEYLDDFHVNYANGGKVCRRRLRTGGVITDGGVAIPMDNDTFLLQGSSHDQINESGNTGIGINVNGKEIEAEGGEVADIKGDSMRIFSDRIKLPRKRYLRKGGNVKITPAQAVQAGYNPDKVFAAQEAYKKNNNLKNPDGKALYGENVEGNTYDLRNGFWPRFRNKVEDFLYNYLGINASDLQHLGSDLQDLGLTSLVGTSDNGTQYSVVPIPSRAGGFRPNAAQISRWTNNAARLRNSTQGAVRQSPIIQGGRNPRIFTEPRTQTQAIRDANRNWLNLAENTYNPYSGAKISVGNQGINNMFTWGQNARPTLTFVERLRSLKAPRLIMPAFNTNAAARTAAIMGSSAALPLLYEGINYVWDDKTNTVVPAGQQTYNTNAVDVNAYNAQHDSLATDTTGLSRAEAKRAGLPVDSTSVNTDSTTVSNNTYVNSLRAAAAREIQSGNPNGPSNRQLQSMVNNGTLDSVGVNAGNAERIINNSVNDRLRNLREIDPVSVAQATILQPNLAELNIPQNNIYVNSGNTRKSRNHLISGRGFDFTWGDVANAGIGITGSILSNIISNRAYNNLRKYAPTAPSSLIALPLRTYYNIHPQLAELERNRLRTQEAINNNTWSSVAALNRMNTNNVNTVEEANKLWGIKFNKENELINESIKNQQDVANKNIEAMNNYRLRLADYNRGIGLAKAQSNVAMIQGIGSSLSNMIQAGMDRYDDNLAKIATLAQAEPSTLDYLNIKYPRLFRGLR